MMVSGLTTADGPEAASVEVEERGGGAIKPQQGTPAIYECVTGAASAMLGGIKMWRTRPRNVRRALTARCAPGERLKVAEIRRLPRAGMAASSVAFAFIGISG